MFKVAIIPPLVPLDSVKNETEMIKMSFDREISPTCSSYSELNKLITMIKYSGSVIKRPPLHLYKYHFVHPIPPLGLAQHALSFSNNVPYYELRDPPSSFFIFFTVIADTPRCDNFVRPLVTREQLARKKNLRY